jgi:hypothetical protein
MGPGYKIFIAAFCLTPPLGCGGCVERLVAYPFTDRVFGNGCYRYVRVSLSMIDGRIIMCDVTNITVSVNKQWVWQPYLNPEQMVSVWVHMTSFLAPAYLPLTRQVWDPHCSTSTLPVYWLSSWQRLLPFVAVHNISGRWYYAVCLPADRQVWRPTAFSCTSIFY